MQKTWKDLTDGEKNLRADIPHRAMTDHEFDIYRAGAKHALCALLMASVVDGKPSLEAAAMDTKNNKMVDAMLRAKRNVKWIIDDDGIVSAPDRADNAATHA